MDTLEYDKPPMAGVDYTPAADFPGSPPPRPVPDEFTDTYQDYYGVPYPSAPYPSGLQQILDSLEKRAPSSPVKSWAPSSPAKSWAPPPQQSSSPVQMDIFHEWQSLDWSIPSTTSPPPTPPRMDKLPDVVPRAPAPAWDCLDKETEDTFRALDKEFLFE